jgi:hypothetical protein
MTPLESAFISDVRAAFLEDRPEILVQRIFKEIDGWSHKHMADNITDTVHKGYTSLSFDRVDPPLRGGHLSDGTEYVWYVPVEWELTINHPQRVPNVNEMTTLQLGSHDGKIVVSSRIQKSLLERRRK